VPSGVEIIALVMTGFQLGSLPSLYVDVDQIKNEHEVICLKAK